MKEVIMSRLKALVVYDSQFGNTEKIGLAMRDALASQVDVEALRVDDVRPEQWAGIGLLIVGSPTQRFSPTPATTQFLKSIPARALKGVRVAAFDTRFTEQEINKIRILAFFVRIFGYAAKPIADLLVRKGGELVLPLEGFYVAETEGPLLEGELERAGDWARRILGEE
jgi:flavodoxin